MARRASALWFAALWLAGCNREALSDGGMAVDLGSEADLVVAPVDDLSVADDLTADPCHDGVTDGEETDVDCGGPTCAACANGKMCRIDLDCQGGLCDGTTCMASEIDFAAAREYFINGGSVDGVAVGDFDGDGVRDLVVTAGGQLVLLRGLGGGRLTAWGPIAVPNYPRAIAAGDLDKDGHTDLVAVVGDQGGANPGVLTVLLSDGKGGFQTILGLPGIPARAPVLLADFDGNGSLDVACPPINGSPVVVAYGDGKGNFGNAVQISINNGVETDAAAGDLNGDGKADLALIVDNKVNVFLSKGGLGFAPAVDYGDGSQTHVAIADLDGDGRLDVATGDRQTPEWTLFRGKGDGTLLAPVDFGTSLWDNAVVATGDFDGDGKVDLFATPGPTDLYLSTGKGGFAAPLAVASSAFQGNLGTAGLALGDLDGDGRSDVAMFGYGLDSVRVYLGRAKTGVYAATRLVSGQWGRGGVLADFNGDGKLDYAHSADEDQNVTIHLGDGKGGFAAGVAHSLGAGGGAIVGADFNGDGHRDLAVATFDVMSGVDLLLGDGKGGFAAPAFTGGNPYGLAVADWNGDGKTDLLGGSDQGSQASFFAGGDTLADPVLIDTGCTQARSVVAGDFDGDGKQDAVFGDNWVLQMTFLHGLGNGGFAAPQTLLPQTYGHVLTMAAGDLDGDNKRDLLAAVETQNQLPLLYFLRGDGKGGFAAPVQYPISASPTSITLADFDGDKELDVAIANNNGAVFIYRNLGQGKLAASLGFGAGGNNYNLLAGDLDGDGKPDLVSDDDVGATVLLNLTK